MHATSEDVRNNFNPNSFVCRTIEHHIHICDLIDRAPSPAIKAEMQTSYGVLYRSSLLNISDFDVTKQLPHDIMHVILEGVLPYECQLSLSALIDQGLFTLDEFNHRLRCFNFSYSDSKSKPESLKQSVFVTGERKLKYSAENARVFIKVAIPTGGICVKR